METGLEILHLLMVVLDIMLRANFDPYVQLANTAHILWTTPLAPGGLIGGEYGSTANSNFYSTAQYECKFKGVVMDGMLYYTLTPGASSYYEGTIAINIRTGQTIWTKTRIPNEWYTKNGLDIQLYIA